MKNIDLKTIIFLAVMIFVTVLIIFLLKVICTAISNSYVSKNKERLFDANRTLSQNCKDLGLLLLEQKITYYEYIKELGLNQTYNCSSSVVSNASNNVIKYLIKYSDIENSVDCLSKLNFVVII